MASRGGHKMMRLLWPFVWAFVGVMCAWAVDQAEEDVADDLTNEPEAVAVSAGQVTNASLEELSGKQDEKKDTDHFQLNTTEAGSGERRATRRRTSKTAAQVLDAGGQEAQRIREDTEFRKAIQQSDESWGAVVYRGLEMAVTTGSVRFGEALGREAAHEAVGGPCIRRTRCGPALG